MAKIERKTQKIFAGNGATDDIAAFGSMITGQPVYTDDMDNLQTTAYTQGWGKAIAANEAPFLEEMNGIQYGFSRQIAYLLQNGIPEWDENTTYYQYTSFAQLNGIIFQSLTNDNIGHNPALDHANWSVFFNVNNVPTLSGNNEFTGQNNFTTVLEYDGVEVANVDASNFSSTGTTTLSTYSLPSTRESTLTLGASGETYTAPANGWFVLTSTVDNATGSYQGYAYITGKTIQVSLGGYLYYHGGGAIPVITGDVLNVIYEDNCTIDHFKFIYATGNPS